jgi:thioredoxin 1
MKKTLVPLGILALLGVLVVFAVMPSTPAASKKLSAEIQTAMDSGQKVFLQLSSTGCVTCRKMKPEFEKVQSEYASDNNFKVIHVDVDAHPTISSKYGVTNVPTQVILSTKGKELFRNMGYLSYDNMKSILNRLINI